jgi:hypothetical protein
VGSEELPIATLLVQHVLDLADLRQPDRSLPGRSQGQDGIHHLAQPLVYEVVRPTPKSARRPVRPRQRQPDRCLGA